MPADLAVHQSREHLSDPHQKPTRVSMDRRCDQSSAHEKIEDGSALRCAATRDREEVGLLGGRATTRALGDVQHDRCARAIQLITQSPQPAQRAPAGGPDLELDGDPIAVEPMALERPEVGSGARDRGRL
jgi:hypothetical protein